MAEEVQAKTGFETDGNARKDLISSILRGPQNAVIPAKRADKKEAEREAKIKTFSGMFDAFENNFVKPVLYPIRTFTMKDSEGVGADADPTYSKELHTFDEEQMFCRGCEIEGVRYYLNNSKQKECPDFKDQIGPILDQVRPNASHILNVKACLHHDTRLFVDMTTDVVVNYKNDIRGDGSFNQHIMLSTALSDQMMWSFEKMLYRQVCSNGMFALAHTTVRNMKKTLNFADRVQNFDITQAVPDFANVFDRLQAKQVPQLDKIVGQLLAKFPQKWQEVFMEQVRIESGMAVPTAFVIYQALAYIIDHATVSDSTRMQFETSAREAMFDIMKNRIQVAEA